jgi:transposase
MSTPPSPKSRRTISKEFKQDAVRLAASVGVRRAAADLGVGESALYAWRTAAQQEGGDAFRGHGQRTAADAELARLHREIAVLKMEREILKKAAEFWVKERQ